MLVSLLNDESSLALTNGLCNECLKDNFRNMEIGCGYFLDALVALPKDLSLRTNLGFTVQP